MTAFGAYWLKIQNFFRKLLQAMRHFTVRTRAHVKH